MAKNSAAGDGKGTTKSISAEEHKANRQATKAKQNAAARARAANGSAKRDSDLFAQIREDIRQDFLTTEQNNRFVVAMKAADAVDVPGIRKSLNVHNPASITHILGMQAAEAAEKVLEAFLTTDPIVVVTQANKVIVKESSLKLACATVRKDMANVEQRVLDFGVNQARNAIIGALKGTKTATRELANA